MVLSLQKSCNSQSTWLYLSVSAPHIWDFLGLSSPSQAFYHYSFQLRLAPLWPAWDIISNWSSVNLHFRCNISARFLSYIVVCIKGPTCVFTCVIISYVDMSSWPFIIGDAVFIILWLSIMYMYPGNLRSTSCISFLQSLTYCASFSATHRLCSSVNIFLYFLYSM